MKTVIIARNGRVVGFGRLTSSHKIECDAVLHSDENVMNDIYDALDKAVADCGDEATVEHPTGTYTVSVSEEE